MSFLVTLFRACLALVLLVSSFSIRSRAEAHQGVVSGRDTKGMSIELVSEVQSIHSGKSFRIGLSIKHDKGFHTYWKNPGVVGMATGVKWELPEGFKVSELHWPYPELSKMAEYPCFGYERDVLLYVVVTPPQKMKSREMEIIANVNWMCCSNTCHPGFKRLNLSLPTGNGDLDEKKSKLFEKAEDELPKVSDVIRAKLISSVDDKQIVVEIVSSTEERLEVVFNSDGQTTPDLNHSLTMTLENTWVFKAERSKYGESGVKNFPFVVKTGKGYIKAVAK